MPDVRINGRTTPWTGAGLHELAPVFLPGADLAVVDGTPVPVAAWNGTVPGEGADVVFARRGTMPDAETYRALLASRNPAGVAERLSRTAVGVAGCGGLGSNAALALARLGVGKLVLVDHDVVEPTNLNRQAFFMEDIGKPKALAVAEMIAKVNPVIGTTALDLRLDPENIPSAFRDCPILLECLDDAGAKRMFVETALSALPGAVVVAASGLAGLGDGNAIAARKVNDRLWLVGDGESGVEKGAGLAAPRVLIAAGQQALCAVRLALGCADAT